MKQTTTLIVGASISGLATAACLRKQGIEYIIIEKENKAATPWRNHYDRLHLHTNKSLSALPYKKFSGKVPRYPSRQQVVDYIDEYQMEFNIQPLFNTEAKAIRKEGEHWHVETNDSIFTAKYVVIATGPYGKAKAINFKGMETFPGKILHSYGYKNSRDFKGQKVLVVGFGNSACEIAIDLYEQDASPFIAVRSAVNIIPRDLLGIPILNISMLMSGLPPRLADAITTPILRMLFGDITKLGLKQMPYGTFEQIKKDQTIPLIDIGTIEHIRQGHIKVYDNIDHITGKTVYFESGRKEDFDAIVAAIGYDRDFTKIIDIDKSRFDDLKFRTSHQKYFGNDGLYFCGFWISPTGQFREIGLDAKKIAKDICRKERSLPIPLKPINVP